MIGSVVRLSTIDDFWRLCVLERSARVIVFVSAFDSGSSGALVYSILTLLISVYSILVVACGVPVCHLIRAELVGVDSWDSCVADSGDAVDFDGEVGETCISGASV